MVAATREAAKADGPCYCGAPSLAWQRGAGQQRTCPLPWFLFFPFFSLGKDMFPARGLLWLLGNGPVWSQMCDAGCAGAERSLVGGLGRSVGRVSRAVLLGEGERLARSGWVALGELVVEAAGQKVWREWRFCALVFRAGGVAWATAKGQADKRPALGGDEMNKCPIRKPFFSSDLGEHELISARPLSYRNLPQPPLSVA